MEGPRPRQIDYFNTKSSVQISLKRRSIHDIIISNTVFRPGRVVSCVASFTVDIIAVFAAESRFDDLSDRCMNE